MKVNKISAAAVLVLAAALSGCMDNPKYQDGDSRRLHIYNWTYYTPHSVIEKFEAEYGAEVVYDEFASNEEMYAKLQAGGSGYDIIFPSGDYVSIMISQDMLEKIDKSKLPNLINVDPLVLSKAVYDPDMNFSVPYYWGAAGIAVNTAKVPRFEKSWAIFGRADLRGRMTMLDDMREVFGDALAHLGYSVNTGDPQELARALDLVNGAWKPNLTKFDAEAFGKGYANGDFWVVQGYAEVIFEEIAGDPELTANTAFFIPPQGGPAYIDSMCVLKGAKNLDLAYAFIDFIHRPEIYAEFTDFFGFPATVNSKAAPLKKRPPFYTVEDLANTELKDDLGEALEMYNAAWETVKVGY
ncbi:MAG: extracellular solute-binding protein [Treponema sp.]|jgi:spermidine/putrescine transport system substrate-binding protein|nr:extracellular solute-binding protein [Treponema sp.]